MQWSCVGRERRRGQQRRDGGDEELLLDLGALADRHGFASLGAFAVSPSHELLAYTLDTTGAEQWSLHVTEIASGAVHACIPGALAVEWADEERLVYTRANRRGRPSTALSSRGRRLATERGGTWSPTYCAAKRVPHVDDSAASVG